jgi:hypothetical protein|tara:strand:- start:124 stop:348 length:225 start_codon:yes stop_codon:yes gene_type:complete
MATENTQNSKDIAELDKRMSTHEVMCDERWKTCFSRLDDLDSGISRLESIAIGACGTIIVGGASVVITMFMMHS